MNTLFTYFFHILFFLTYCLSLSFIAGSKVNSIPDKLKWGTYRPDLLYEYSKIDENGLAFGILFHSNTKLDFSRIERCPKFSDSFSYG